MFDHLLQEDGSDLLQETGYWLLLDTAAAQYLWINDTSYEGAMRLSSFLFEEAAEQGQVGTGGFDLDDDSLTASVPALKSAQYSDFRASEPRVFTGYTHTRTTQRGPMLVAGQREWGVELLDVNTLLDDDVMTLAGADRPAETERTRVVWLLNNVLVDYGVSFGIAPNTNTVNMDAIDYRGKKPRELLDQCAEISGKNYFLYADSTGIYLYYDLSTGTSLSATAKISDLDTDVDNSTVWGPIGPPTVRRSPDEVYSTVHLTWSGGVVTVSNAATASAYRTREINVIDMGVRTSTTATAKANAFLASSASERTYISDISLRLPAANVNDFRAGYRAQIKLLRHGISSYTYYRILRRAVRALPGSTGASDVEYLVTLTLLDTLAPTRYLYQRGSNEVWEVKSNATDDGASVIVNRDGITVTQGAITVKNVSGNTLIDGATNSGTIQNSAANVKIDANGLTVTGGAMTVKNASGTTIFDASGNGEVTNQGGSVTIDSTGLTVTNGNLIIEDEFGKTVMEASGFAGSWTSFVRLGLYNAQFTDLTVGTLAIGRTSDLPYWNLSRVTGTPTFTGLSGGGVKFTPTALNDDATGISDKVAVRPGASMEAGYAYKVNRAAGTLTLQGFVLWYQADGSASSTASSTFDQTVLTSSVSTLQWSSAGVLVPNDATQAAFEFRAIETVTHNAANTVTFYAAKLVDLPGTVPFSWATGATVVSPGSGTVNNYDPGSIDATPAYLVDPSGALTLTGLVAPSDLQRLILFINKNGSNTITLKNENASSTAANRFQTPGAADFVIPVFGGAYLWYDSVEVRWRVISK